MGEIGILEGVGAGDRLMIGFRYRAIENGATVDVLVDVIINAPSSSSWSSSVLPVSPSQPGGRPGRTNTYRDELILFRSRVKSVRDDLSIPQQQSNAILAVVVLGRERRLHKARKKVLGNQDRRSLVHKTVSISVHKAIRKSKV